MKNLAFFNCSSDGAGFMSRMVSGVEMASPAVIWIRARVSEPEL